MKKKIFLLCLALLVGSNTFADSFTIPGGGSGGATDARLESGTADGQILYWDDTGTQWKHTETNEAMWDDATKSVILDGALATSSTNPALAFGDGDTGFFESSDDVLDVAFIGGAYWRWNSANLTSTATNGANLLRGGSTSTSPAFVFNADADTGMGRAAADQASLIAGGVETARVQNNGLTDQFIVSPDGIQNDPSVPSLAFGDGNTGFYESADNTLEVSIIGTPRWEFAINAFRGQSVGTPNLQNQAGTTTTPNYTFFGDLNTGFSRSASDEISVIAGSANIGIFKNDATDTTRAYFEANEIRERRKCFRDLVWASMRSEWSVRTSTGTESFQPVLDGGFRLITGAASGNEESKDWGDITTFANTRQPDSDWTVLLEQTTVIGVEFGMIEAAGGGDDDYIRIYYDTALGGPWTFEVCTAGTCTSDTGPAADTSAHTFSIYFDTDTQVQWFYDGVTQGVISTNVPTALLQPYFAVRTNEAASHYAQFSNIEICQDPS